MASEVFSELVTSVSPNDSSKINDSRREYEILINNPDGKQLLEKEIVEPTLRQLGIEKNETTPVKIRVINMHNMEHNDYLMSSTFTVGRLPLNDIVINNMLNSISRIHFIVFFANNKVVLMDTWSLNGTSTVNNSTLEEVKSAPHNRTMISFDIGVRFMIKIENYAIVFNQDMKSQNTKDCLICVENPRSIRFGCGHSCTCEICAKIIIESTNSCPICKQKINTSEPTDNIFTYMATH